MASVGVTELIFGDSPDGDFVDDLPALQNWVEQIVSEFCPDWIAVTAFEQGHLDHDALNWATRHLKARKFEYPMYHHYARVIQRIHQFAHGDAGEDLRLTSEESRWKRELLSNYPSQSVARNIRWVERLGKITRRPNDLFLTERLRPVPDHDYLRPAHPVRLQARIERSREWKRWLRAMRHQVV